MSYRLSKIVSPAFSIPHQMLKSAEVNQLVLKGGRGSTKSSFASIEGILAIIKHEDIHGVVMRKVANTLRTTVYPQYRWAISALGLDSYFKCTVSPMELTYLPTGQKIMFFGADDPSKIKSLKVPFGYVGFLHFEELDQFSGEEEVRNIEQSVLRGGNIALEIKSFNPPKTKDNWANKYCLLEKPKQLIHTSNYLTTPIEWLGNRFLEDAQFLKETNYTAYEHEYLGIANSSGGNVFENVVLRDIEQSEINSFDNIANGVDWGWYPDPFAFVRCQYQSAQRRLIIFDEIVVNKKSNEQTANLIKQKKIGVSELVTCDSAEPKSINDFRAFGISARKAIKGAGSIEYSYKWLQGLNEIVIDRKRTPVAYEEFMNMEYERDRNGNIISGYPDKDNHVIDATRYATEQIWKRRGQ